MLLYDNDPFPIIIYIRDLIGSLSLNLRCFFCFFVLFFFSLIIVRIRDLLIFVGITTFEIVSPGVCLWIC